MLLYKIFDSWKHKYELENITYFYKIFCDFQKTKLNKIDLLKYIHEYLFKNTDKNNKNFFDYISKNINEKKSLLAIIEDKSFWHELLKELKPYYDKYCKEYYKYFTIHKESFYNGEYLAHKDSCNYEYLWSSLKEDMFQIKWWKDIISRKNSKIKGFDDLNLSVKFSFIKKFIEESNITECEFEKLITVINNFTEKNKNINNPIVQKNIKEFYNLMCEIIKITKTHNAI